MPRREVIGPWKKPDSQRPSSKTVSYVYPLRKCKGCTERLLARHEGDWCSDFCQRSVAVCQAERAA